MDRLDEVSMETKQSRLNPIAIDTLELLIYLCTYFRNCWTLCNYITHKEWASGATSVDLQVLGEPLLRRAKQCAEAVTVLKEKRWLQLPLVLKLMALAVNESDLVAAALYGLSYTFMARVTYEIIRAMIPGDGIACGTNPVLVLAQDAVTLKL